MIFCSKANTTHNEKVLFMVLGHVFSHVCTHDVKSPLALQLVTPSHLSRPVLRLYRHRKEAPGEAISAEEWSVIKDVVAADALWVG